MYAILVTHEEGGLCRSMVHQGKRPFIAGSKREAERYKEMLSSNFPDAEYTIYKLEKT